MAKFKDDLLVAQPIPGGYSWTLASRLGAFLHEAEARYGPRDLSFTILGVEFQDEGPQIWFPGDRKYVVIQLTTTCLADERRAVFQLAHECIHLLHPIAGGTATVLEEGLATLFSIDRVRDLHGVDYPVGNRDYELAAKRVQSLLALDLDGIGKLRTRRSSLSAVTSEDLQWAYPSLQSQPAEELCRRFGG